MPQLDGYLTQPEQFVIKNQTIIFLTPPQENLQTLENILSNFSIKLLAKRVGDGYTSNREFEFKYINHRHNSCPFCDMNVDTDELVQIEAGIHKPKPGTTLTPYQLDNLGDITENAEFVVLEDDAKIQEAKQTAGELFAKRMKILNGEQAEFASEKEVRQALG